MNRELTERVWERANGRCEYCQMSQEQSLLPFQIDHIIARKHSGETRAANLALSCYYCNSFKGSNISGLDPKTRPRRLVSLFNPRRMKWSRHFRWEGPHLRGRTSVGRATVVVLMINLDLRVAHRQVLIEASVFPPNDSSS